MFEKSLNSVKTVYYLSFKVVYGPPAMITDLQKVFGAVDLDVSNRLVNIYCLKSSIGSVVMYLRCSYSS